MRLRWNAGPGWLPCPIGSLEFVCSAEHLGVAPGLWDPGKDEVREELGSSFGERVADASRDGNIQGQLQEGL